MAVRANWRLAFHNWCRGLGAHGRRQRVGLGWGLLKMLVRPQRNPLPRWVERRQTTLVLRRPDEYWTAPRRRQAVVLWWVPPLVQSPRLCLAFVVAGHPCGLQILQFRGLQILQFR